MATEGTHSPKPLSTKSPTGDITDRELLFNQFLSNQLDFSKLVQLWDKEPPSHQSASTDPYPISPTSTTSDAHDMYQRPNSPDRRYPLPSSSPPQAGFTRPRGTSGNRSGKVIEELQTKLEVSHRELVFTKQQLDIARQAKGNAEQTAQELSNANSKLRSEMAILLSMTDRKDRQIEEQREKMGKLDTQFKQQKDQSTDAKKQLEKLVSEQKSIFNARDEAIEAKMLAEHQYNTLVASFASLQGKYTADIASLKKDLESVKALVTEKAKESIELSAKAEKKMTQILNERSGEIDKVEMAQKGLEENRQKFAVVINKQIEELKREIDSSLKTTEGYEGVVGEVKQEVDALLAKIRSFKNIRPET